MNIRHPKLLATMALTALAYVLLGTFEDVPPRGISLTASTASIHLQEGLAQVQARLTYRCHSWRHRGAAVYLPFSHAEGEGEAILQSSQVPSSDSVQQFADGLILNLSMDSDCQHEVAFEFQQPLAQRRFCYLFGVPRGWDFYPNLVEVKVQAPAGWKISFRPQPLSADRKQVADQVVYTLPADIRQGVTMEWDGP